jgi:sugar phosphate isomerase/epimerase
MMGPAVAQKARGFHPLMPQLAAFPKGWMDELCRTGTMSLVTWLDMARALGIDGVELYSGMIDLQDPARWPHWRAEILRRGLAMPMLCCSPDFTQPDPALRQREIDRELHWIDMTAALGGQYCRVLSGQKRPDVTTDQGLSLAASAIITCLPYAADRGVTLILENHYKDNYWTHPEFAQRADLFCALVDRVDDAGHSNFGVNFDPSNALIAGDDPIALLARVRHRVVTMHASDRYLTEGTPGDLRDEEGSEGYAARLHHGEIGRGLIDYPSVFRLLHEAGFDGWISIEDGVDGMEQLQRSVTFLRRKMAEHWPLAV